MDRANDPEYLTIHGQGSHNVAAGGSMTPALAVYTPRGKLPSDETIDKLIDDVCDVLGTVPYESDRERLRTMVRDWYIS